MARKAKPTGGITSTDELIGSPRRVTWREEAEAYLARMDAGLVDLAGDPVEVLQAVMLAIEEAESTLSDDGPHSVTLETAGEMVERAATEWADNVKALAKVTDERDTAEADRDKAKATAAHWEAQAIEARNARDAAVLEARDLNRALGAARASVIEAHAELGREQRARQVDVDTWRAVAKAMEEQRDASRASARDLSDCLVDHKRLLDETHAALMAAVSAVPQAIDDERTVCIPPPKYVPARYLARRAQ